MSNPSRSRTIWLAVLGLLFIAGVYISFNAGVPRAVHRPALVPYPREVELRAGEFKIRPQTTIYAELGAEAVANYLAQTLERATRSRFKVAPYTQGTNLRDQILLAVDVSLKAPEEYALEVTRHSISVRASTAAGWFYGVQTLLQLLPATVYGSGQAAAQEFLPATCAKIKDSPRFEWRGFLLDTARHFFSTGELERVMDEIGMHKINRFQLHLTDDQGWRVQIRSYPKLTEIGAWRTNIGFKLDPKSSTAYGADGRYGGFYSQADVRKLVAYAQARQIMLVPEIEMPGHAGAALAAYPELSCFGGPYTTEGEAGVFAAVFCPGKEETFQFLETVLTEVMDLFPGKYIHIGGDEVPKDNWKKCAACQARMKAEHLKNEEELQGYFIRRIAKFIQSKGRSVVGWSEILQGGLPPDAVMMDWIGGGVEAANAGHPVVMTPVKYCYFDYYQSTNHATEPRAIGGFVPLEKVYSFEPVPADLHGASAKLILGPQANLWTEYIANLPHVEYMTFPRLCAMAEVAWSPRRKGFEEFENRLKPHLERLAAMGVNYRQLQGQVRSQK